MTNKLKKCQQEPQQYEVDAILDQFFDGKRPLYLVKWKGYSDKYNTWQPRSHLANVPEKLREWSRVKKSQKKNHPEEKIIKTEAKQALSNSKLFSKKHMKSEKNNSSYENLQFTNKNHKKVEAANKRKVNNEIKARNKQILKYQRLSPCNNIKNQSNEIVNASKISKRQSLRNKKYSKSLSTQLQSSQHDQQSNQSFDTNTISKRQKRKIKPTKNSYPGQEFSIFEREKTLKSRLQSRGIFLDKTDVNEDQDLIIIEQSQSEPLQEERITTKQNQGDKIDQKDNVILPIEEFIAEYYPQDNQSSQKIVSTYQDQQIINQIPEKDNQIENIPSSILEQGQLRSLSPLPNFNPPQDEDNLNLFLIQPEEEIGTVDQINFESMSEIVKIFKQSGIVYCDILNKDNSMLQKVQYSFLQEKRSDLITSFFSQEVFANQT